MENDENEADDTGISIDGRKKRILAEMGYDSVSAELDTQVEYTADIDEKAIRRDKPEDLVVAIAQAKADEIISKPGGVIREKPTTKDEARLFIKGYSGSHGGVVGSVLVYFHEIPEKVIDDIL
ncbi:unnamed protein product [Eruca vesicaria subsp. sativa]|uniref:Uncharacterized protein n=1 Tax=Eruca vesicaria subsp. sativa TaxID=29727 RepID=A0ABC8JWV8_ERUVS|nr:unnamed protein product [Eruca vesicaria subsp. sativa]